MAVLRPFVSPVMFPAANIRFVSPLPSVRRPSLLQNQGWKIRRVRDHAKSRDVLIIQAQELNEVIIVDRHRAGVVGATRKPA